MSAAGVITTVGVVVATSESAALIKRRSLSMRVVLAGFILGLFLFPLDSAQPEFAKSVMILIVLSALIVNGESLFKLIGMIPNTAKS